jgi:D-serine deaminase-like pyridoxal phosphate-dependent protein
MKLEDLPTPALLVDLDRVEANCAAMSIRAHGLGVRLRPHMKTHKCVEIGRLQVAGHFGGITVSTLAEARHFAAAGVDDITLAVPLAPARAQEAVSLGVNVLVDSDEAIAAIESASRNDAKPQVWLKVDCGYGRAGVCPGSESAVAMARRLDRSPHLEFSGLLTHGGHSYDCVDAEGIKVVAQQERDAVTRFAEQLRAEGIVVAGVSVGSTPTMMHVDHLRGVTEIRPGNYALFDRFQAAIGSCTLDDVAVTVLGSVLSVFPDRAILDVGALALSKDPGPTHVDPGCGFGGLLGLDNQPLSGLSLVGLSQEHGKVKGPGTASLTVGDRVRVLPNHSCLSMACFPVVHGVRGTAVVAEWRPCRGW